MQYQVWAESPHIKPLIDRLLTPAPETDALTVVILAAYAGVAYDQVNANSADYLPNGTLYELYYPREYSASDDDNEEAGELALRQKWASVCPNTSDAVERVFGVLSRAIDICPNLSLETASGVTTYR